MKRKVLFLFGMIIITLAQAQAQAPPGISHQAVIRDANNDLVINSEIGIRVSILQGGAGGDAVYVEIHTPMSNVNGLITYIIGEGDVVEGLFADIDWSDGPFWLETKADPDGGTNYSITGTTQFLSVPYAMHSETAEIAETLKDGSHLGEINYWDGENWVPIEPGEHNQALRLCDGVPTWGPCLYELALFADPLDGGTVTGTGEYEEGTEVSITATPNLGWEFAIWSGDTDNVHNVDTRFATVTMPAEGISLTANFQEEVEPILYSLDLIVHPEGAGTVYGEGEYEYGEEVAVLATAYEGWEFVNWTDINGIELFDDASVVFDMPDVDLTFIASFQEEESDIIYGDGVTDIDGNEYVTVVIGDQEWMAENLRVTRYTNEDDIPTGLSNEDWEDTTEGAYAIYNNNNDMLEAYGKLYNWYAVDDARGLCPAGWSVPSDADWTALVDYVVSQGYPNEWNNPNGAGNALKSCRQVDHPDGGDCDTSEHPRWNSDDTHSGFDKFGFSAFPGGQCWLDGSFRNVGLDGICWSATEYRGVSAWSRNIYSYHGYVNLVSSNKRKGFSVRCLRDETEEPTTYNLHLEANPENAGTVSGAGDYQDGEEVNITATPGGGWEFVEWTGDTKHLDDADLYEAVVTMPAGNVSLTAVFQQEDDSDIIYGDGVTDIDDNEYVTVVIGEQEWMAENLRVTRYNNEDDITKVLIDWSFITEGGYVIYDHNASNTDGINSPEEMAEAYGKLYNWYAVDDGRGLCPEGWSVPSDDDWTQLVDYIMDEYDYHNDGGSEDINGVGNALKSCRQVDHPDGGDCDTSEHPRWNYNVLYFGFDEFGFSALPGGVRDIFPNDDYESIGHEGYWWSSSETPSTGAWYRAMISNQGNVGRVAGSKNFGFSVRCIKDITEEPTLYNLNLEVHPEGAGTVYGEGEYEYGEEVAVLATAYEGWEFVNWTGDTEHLDDADLYEAVVTMPAGDVTLTAVFQEEDEDPGFSCGDNITFTYRGQEVTYGTIFRNGLCWLDHNLGADPMPFVPADDATGNTGV